MWDFPIIRWPTQNISNVRQNHSKEEDNYKKRVLNPSLLSLTVWLWFHLLSSSIIKSTWSWVTGNTSKMRNIIIHNNKTLLGQVCYLWRYPPNDIHVLLILSMFGFPFIVCKKISYCFNHVYRKDPKISQKTKQKTIVGIEMEWGKSTTHDLTFKTCDLHFLRVNMMPNPPQRVLSCDFGETSWISSGTSCNLRN